MVEPSYLTPKGLEKLKAELGVLVSLRRHEVAERIQRAKQSGGTVENGEYDEAKNEQAFMEGRIIELERLISTALVIDKSSTPLYEVGVGSTVTVMDDKGKTSNYKIIGSTEANPSHGTISNVSPIGQALLGGKVGQVAEVNVPSGTVKLEIVRIS
jgi:transcription elongation factor GreA